MPEASTDEREKELKRICKSKTVKAFKRSLTESDIEKELRVYADFGISLQEKEAEKSEVVKTHNEAIKAVEAEMDLSLEIIKNGKKEVSDALYNVPNFETGQMETFDKFGELIETRGLTPDEHTGHLFGNDGSDLEEKPAEVPNDQPRQIGFEKTGENTDISDAEIIEENEDLPNDPGNDNDDFSTDPEIIDGDLDEKKSKKGRKPKNNPEV